MKKLFVLALLSTLSFPSVKAQSFLYPLVNGALNLITTGSLRWVKNKCQSSKLDKKSELHLVSQKYRIAYKGGEYSEWVPCNVTCEISPASKRTLIINDSGKTTTFVVDDSFEVEDRKGCRVLSKCFLYGVPCTVVFDKRYDTGILELRVPYGPDKTICYFLSV